MKHSCLFFFFYNPQLFYTFFLHSLPLFILIFTLIWNDLQMRDDIIKQLEVMSPGTVPLAVDFISIFI